MKLTVVLFIAGFWFCTEAKAQSKGDLPPQLTDAFQKRAAEQPVEKVHLHLDKGWYAAGDRIWFKAYVVEGNTHKPSTISKVLNVVLVNDRKLVIHTVKLPIIKGYTWGDITLRDSLPAGNYHLLAYTNWMLNSSPVSCFDLRIPIGNSIVSKPVVQKVSSISPQPQPDIQFFPEGGKMVNGLTSNIAFKAIAASGSGIDVKGVIIDNNNKEVARFKSGHAGMGVFSLKQEAGNTYIAKLTYPDGSIAIGALPAAVDKGYIMAVDHTADHIAINIRTSAATLQDGGKGSTLIAQANGHVYYAEKVNLNGDAATINIPVKEMPTGILQLTLFSDGVPINERLVFVQNNDQLKLDVAAQQTIYSPRTYVQMGIHAKDGTGKNITGSFSASVTDESKVKVDEEDEHTILSDLLLTSDLKGYVEKPNYYFIDPNEKKKAELDVLMLTQGYRGFEWKPLYQPETGLTITGSLLTPRGKPVVGGKVTLLVKLAGQVTDTVTDDNGHFLFKNLLFPDSTRFVVQGRTAGGSDNVIVKIDDEPYVQLLKGMNFDKDPEMPSDTLFQRYLTISKSNYDQDIHYGINGRGKMLNQVNITAKKAVKELQYSANLNGPGHADQVVLGSELENRGGRLTDILTGKLAGVLFQGDQPVAMGSSYSPITDNSGPPPRGMPPMMPMIVILDGTVIPSNMLNSLSIDEIASIEVLRTASYLSIYGSRAATGALVISTRHSSGAVYDRRSPGIVNYMPNGYYQSKTFYAPKYNRQDNGPQLADLRSTIFWHPNLLTDKDGKAAFYFYNADSKGTYKVVVEGMDADGRFGRQVYRYRVE